MAIVLGAISWGAIALGSIALGSIALGSVSLGGCSRPDFRLGEGCDVNSDCAAPLACTLGACRRQCVDSRDCGAGLRCLIVDPEVGGGCQLDDEAECVLTSECRTQPGTDDLICQNGTCTTQCREDRDCANGASCREGTDGVLGCYEEVVELCIYNTDCPAPMVCGPDQLCRIECFETRDCPFPRVCAASLCELPDGG